MYEIDEHDLAVPISGFPQFEPGAPYPLVAANEHSLRLAYICRNMKNDPTDTVAIVAFGWARIHLFGTYSNHNSFRHPLFGRGLKLYGAFQVENSSLMRSLAPDNESTHYIPTFHDSTFECVARGFSVETYALEGDHRLNVGIND